ncbi:hypothetical protein OPV22_030897 [Ensete ventricosum]|uniref:Uncharacterized protein n=1 Tax=Ensete ventricosum TaxID=4639 RepID=A0AAV8P0U9_ENSVE|nr:hypothetical protein OPV22_030897 [Ensete ventricosum]
MQMRQNTGQLQLREARHLSRACLCYISSMFLYPLREVSTLIFPNFMIENCLCLYECGHRNYYVLFVSFCLVRIQNYEI